MIARFKAMLHKLKINPAHNSPLCNVCFRGQGPGLSLVRCNRVLVLSFPASISAERTRPAREIVKMSLVA